MDRVKTENGIFMSDKGDLIDKHMAEDENFAFQVGELIQKIRLEGNQEQQNLYATISSLRIQLDTAIHEKKKAIQEAVVSKNLEIQTLKASIIELRNQLEIVQYEKKEAVQKAVLESVNEIENLKETTRKLREDLQMATDPRSTP